MMQPTFLPWQGFFGLICACDRFVFGDDYHYSAGSFHQRNRLFRNRGEVTWMTVPMQKKCSTGLPLNAARIADDPPWRQHMWKQIHNTYRSTPFFGPVAPRLEHWLLTPAGSLAEQNIGFVRLACDLMALKRDFRLSSQRPAALARSRRVVDLLQWCEARVYLCAGGSFGYMKSDGVFPVNGIDVLFQDFQPPAYPQAAARGKFVPYLSILDALFNIGPEATRELIDAHSTKWRTWDEMLAANSAHLIADLEPYQENAVMSLATITIAGRTIGPRHPTYVIAEMSGNHNQSFQQAERIVRAAKDAGADALKLQTYTADTITLDSDLPCFRVAEGTLWSGQTLHKLYQEAYTPWEWQPKLKELADELGMHCFSSPFDPTAVDFLEAMDVPAYKVASFELVDLPLIEKMARTGKPIIMSIGTASVSEIDEAVRAARPAGAGAPGTPGRLALLKCTSAYPAPPEEMNLRTIPHLSQMFGVPAGLSDHSMGIAVPVAAVALGACIIEKHLTIARSEGGPDSAFSLEPREFRAMVEAIRVAEQARGKVCYEVTEREAVARAYRRSLFVVNDVRQGEAFTRENVRSIRPADGLPPKYLNQVLGRKATRDLAAGSPLAWDMIG